MYEQSGLWVVFTFGNVEMPVPGTIRKTREKTREKILVRIAADPLITVDEGLGKIALSLGFDVVASPDLMLRSLIAGEIEFRDFEKSIRSLVLENRLGSTVAELYIKEGQEYVEL